MEKLHFEYQWPKDNLFIDCFIHEVFNYRYHWHSDMYELSILLSGTQEFCIGTSSVHLKENDAVLIAPQTGHASSALQPNTRSLVLHFSPAAFKAYVGKEEMFIFPECCSAGGSQTEPRFRTLRFYAGHILKSSYDLLDIDHTRKGSSPEGRIELLHIRGAIELLLYTLLHEFHPQIVHRHLADESEERMETMRRIIAYLEAHFTEKVTLEDLARYSMYNRTYISTLFKSTVGIGFHEYLTRLRFQHALFELATTSRTLTEIALSNGFSDLKSFTAHFREVLHRTPQEYRRQLIGRNLAVAQNMRKYIPGSDQMVQQKLAEFITLAPPSDASFP